MMTSQGSGYGTQSIGSRYVHCTLIFPRLEPKKNISEMMGEIPYLSIHHALVVADKS